MTEIEIKQFSALLSGHIDSKKKIKNVETKKLPQAGYGSVMLKVAVTLTDENGSEVKLYAVAKLLPQDEFVKKVFQIELTYKQEVSFYKTVLPTLTTFAREQGVRSIADNFAKYYGSRLSLDKDQLDDDAVLLLEDLSVTGFKNIDRQEGFNLEGARRILKDLARFQGTAIALKLKNPKLFEDNVKAFCRDFIFLDEVVYTEMIKDCLKENEACASLAGLIGKWPCKIPTPKEPYATIAHADLWVNNTMQKFNNEDIVSNKFVDFQVYSYRSCASDVFFFLWTSCQKNVIENHMDDLIKYYHDILVKIIKEFNCDISQFSLEKFLEDIVLESMFEFGHALTFVVIAKKGPIISDENIENKISREEYIAQLPQNLKEFLYFMTQECHKRGWLH